MKTFLILLVGAILGIVGYQYYQHSQHPTLAQRADDAADATRHTAGEVKDVVVEKSKVVGEKVEDAAIITAIKGKYLIDRDLSTLTISVSCADGHVTLTGKVASGDLLARAVKIASDTGGVTAVESRLTVQN